MIIDALLSADPYLKIAERVFKPKEYLHLTDAIMPFIEASTEPVTNPFLRPLLYILMRIFYQELAQARAIFDRIHTRDLYKCVDFKVIDWPLRPLFQKHITAARIVEASRALSVVEDGDSASLQESDVVISFRLMHFGMKEKNPLDFVRFYSKHDLTRKFFFSYYFFIYYLIIGSHNAQRGDYSGMTPQWFAEELIQVYTKKPQFFGLVQAGYRAVLANMPNDVDLTRLETLVTTSTFDPTPPATEAPSTPKAKDHSRNSSFSFPTTSGPYGTPFSNNSFTTVPSSFVPGSPTRNDKKRRGKRSHDDLPQHEDIPKKRQKQRMNS